MVSQNYINASIQSLLQSVADQAGKASALAGELADAKAMIVEQQAKIDELQKVATPPTP